MSLHIQFGSSLLLLLLYALVMGSACTQDTTSTASIFGFGTSPASSYDPSDYSTTAQPNDKFDQDNVSVSSTTTNDYFQTTTEDPERYVCPDGFKQLTIDWCFHFRFDMDNRLNFEESQDYCEKKEAILPAITSVDVTSALMLERTNKMGLSPFEAFFIGLGCNVTGVFPHTWMWIDGPDYDPSDAFFGRQGTDSEYCDRFQPPYVFDNFGTWQDQSKYFEQNLVVCAQRPRGYSPPAPINSPCIDDWTQLPGGQCYRLTSEFQENIYSAEMACRNNGGHLPSIHSAEQTNIIQGYLTGRKYQNTQFWIGLYCTWDEDYETVMGRIGKRIWSDGSPYDADGYTNFLSPDDDTDRCNVGLVDTFVYNGALKGKWQKQKSNWTVLTLMCIRPDPEPIPSTTPTTTKKTTTTARRTTQPIETTTTSVDDERNSDTTDDYTDPTTESADHTTEHTTVGTTTTTSEPTTTSHISRHALTQLELILIIMLASITLTVIIVIMLYFLCKRIRKERVQEIVSNMQKRFSRSNTNAIVRTDEWEIKRQFVGIDYSRQLGRGAFGSVYLGRVFPGNIPDMAVRTILQLNTLKKGDNFVAVKMLHETADRQASTEFMEEIEVMKQIGFHERLVNLLACVTETEPLLLIVEYCSNGDLLKFMRGRRAFMLKLKDTVGDSIAGRHSVITQRQQLMFGIQIAYGM
ncbi:hypothetical protein PMAYCL1PPCAC_22417, partial [Pristionchus mayeri]